MPEALPETADKGYRSAVFFCRNFCRRADILDRNGKEREVSRLMVENLVHFKNLIKGVKGLMKN
jgi:hypothetical protein